MLTKNKWVKKYFKMFIYWKGMRSVEKAAFSSTYQTVWVAGPSIEYTKKVEPMKDIVKRFTHAPE